MSSVDEAPNRRGDAQRWLGVLFVLHAVVGLALYWPALEADFYSDDEHYVVYNDYVHALSADNLSDIANPRGAVAMMTQNYAPLHLVAHAVEWQFFGASPRGYHVVNVLVHALASTLLAALFFMSGAPLWAAAGAGTAFLLHPANVEAVAWISQLKTTGALALVLAALLLRERRPALGLSFFVMALLTKALAAFALPVALLFAWVARVSAREGEGGQSRDEGAGRGGGKGEGGSVDEVDPDPDPGREWLWLAAWGAAFVALTVMEFPLFRITNLNAPPLHPEWSGQLIGILTIAARYLVMAVSSLGVSAFHEVVPGDSILEPWPLLGAVALLGLAARAFYALAQGQVEAVYWGWAAISFIPICQIFPFLYPMGDRYLYFILPGLLGGVLFAALGFVGALPESRRVAVVRALAVLALAWLFAIGLHGFQRTRIWSNPAYVDGDAIQRYPDGLLASIYAAQRAAIAGDGEATVRWLRRGLERGNYHFWSLQNEALWEPVRGHPGFAEVMQAMARYWVEVEPLYRHPSQIDLRAFADAHALLGDYEAARDRLERALEVGGVRDDEVRRKLVQVRLELARSAAGHGTVEDD